MLMTHLILIRHGQTDWNLNSVCQGQQDIPLNEAGLAESRALAAHLAATQIDVMVASDLERARQTAEVVNQHHNLPIQYDARLREMHFGEWEGQPFEALKKAYPHYLSYWLFDPVDPPGGEHISQFARRVYALYDDIIEQHAGLRIALIGHGGALKLIICRALGMPVEARWQLRMGNTAVAEIDIRDEGGILTRYNDMYHLNGLRRQDEPLPID